MQWSLRPFLVWNLTVMTGWCPSVRQASLSPRCRMKPARLSDWAWRESKDHTNIQYNYTSRVYPEMDHIRKLSIIYIYIIIFSLKLATKWRQISHFWTNQLHKQGSARLCAGAEKRKCEELARVGAILLATCGSNSSQRIKCPQHHFHSCYNVILSLGWYGSGIILGIVLFPCWDFFWISCPVRFPSYLQHVGAGSCHFNCCLQHFGVWTSHFPRYLQHFGARIVHVACYFATRIHLELD